MRALSAHSRVILLLVKLQVIHTCLQNKFPQVMPWTPKVNLLLSIGLQLAISTIILSELSFDTYDANLLVGLKGWRQDVTAGIADRVCARDHRLPSNALQVTVLREVHAFLSSIGREGLEAGPLLSGIAIFVWTSNISGMLRNAFDFVRAVQFVYFDYAAESFSICRAHGKDGLIIHGVTQARLWWACLLCLLQLCIGLLLLVSGAAWLAVTRSVPELLVNSVALSYTLQVDHLVFQAFVPQRAKALLRSVRSIDMGKGAQPRLPGGIPDLAIAALGFAIIFPAVMTSTFVWPHAVQMRELRNELCP